MRGLLQYLQRLLRALLALPEPTGPKEPPPPAAARLVLARRAPASFAADGERLASGVAGVAVFDEASTEPVPGVRVRYNLLRGEAQLNGGSSAVVSTDADGVATVDVEFPARGAVRLSAEIDGTPENLIVFDGRTMGMTDELVLYSEPAVSVDPGEVDVRIVAYDPGGAPVQGAEMSISASHAPDIFVEGEVAEVGDGVYAGRLTINRAGEWAISVKDLATNVLARRCVHLVAAPPASIAFVGETDPRREEPYDRVVLRANLIDRFGNPYPPERLVAESESLAETSYFRDEARFTVAFAGAGHVPIRIRDTDSDVTLDTVVDFSAAILADPGFVEVGSRFETPLFGFLPPDEPSDHAVVRIQFDPALVAFAGIRRDGAPEVNVDINEELTDGQLLLELRSETPVDGRQHPEGIYIGTIEWDCLDEGPCCFTVFARLSPERPGWELCPDQKRKQTKEVCVNIIYPPGALAAPGRAAGDTAVATIQTVISSAANVNRCCPVIRVTRRYCQYTAAQWAGVLAVIGTDGNQAVSTPGEFNALVGLGACRVANCYNLRMIAFNDPNAGGRTQIGPPGEGALDPGLAGRANVGAHEFGHAVGLPDLYRTRPDGTFDGGPAGNLMSFPHGTDLTADQCRTIWQNIDSYVP